MIIHHVINAIPNTLGIQLHKVASHHPLVVLQDSITIKLLRLVIIVILQFGDVQHVLTALCVLNVSQVSLH